MFRFYKYLFFFLFCSHSITSITYAQIRASVETSGIVSTSDKTPFWLQSNRNGIYSRHGSQILTRFQISGESEVSDRISFFYGADLIGRPGTSSSLSFTQGYLKIHGYGFEFAAGRFHNTSPVHDRELGLGSLGISGNATPIPQIRIGLIDWTPVPWTGGYMEVRGHLAHGWLGDRRYTENAFLHEKTAHARFGGNLPLNLYGGLAHYALWGGNNPRYGTIPTRLSDYKRVFFALPGDELAPGPMQAYIYGDHLGAWDFGFFLELNNADITVYRQFPFETKDNLKLKSLQDALTGISIQFSDQLNLPLDRLTYEYLYTKYQDGPRRDNNNLNSNLERDRYRGNENYYNHEIYRTGWVYNRRIIGNPLFIPNGENIGIVNNRIIAHHVGFMSTRGSTTLSGKATFSRNYGKRCDNRIPDLGEGDLFGIQCENVVENNGGISLNQWSFLMGVETPLHLLEGQEFILFVEMAFDNGKLVGDQFGSLAGLRWRP